MGDCLVMAHEMPQYRFTAGIREVNAQERAGEKIYDDEDQLSFTHYPRKMRRMEVSRGRESRLHPTPSGSSARQRR